MSRLMAAARAGTGNNDGLEDIEQPKKKKSFKGNIVLCWAIEKLIGKNSVTRDYEVKVKRHVHCAILTLCGRATIDKLKRDQYHLSDELLHLKARNEDREAQSKKAEIMADQAGFEKELLEQKKQMAEIIEMRNSAYEARASKDYRSPRKAEKYQAYIQEIQRAGSGALEQDRKLKEIMATKVADRTRGLNLDGNASRNRHGELLQRVKAVDDQNFSLFNYVNEINNEFEKMAEEIVHAQRKLNALQVQMIAADEETKLMKKVMRFNELKNATDALLGSHGVTDINLFACLGLLEHKSNDLFSSHYAFNLPKKGSAGEGKGDGMQPAVAIPINGFGGLLGQGGGPQAAIGNMIFAPLTDHDSNEMAVTDGNERPLTRDELTQKTLRGLVRMGCFEPFAVKLKAFAQKLKASLKKKPQQSARTATPLREQAVAEATAVVESGEVASIQVPTAAEVVTATVEAVDTETKVPFESSLSQLATTAIAHEVAIGQRLAAAKYGVALEAIEPKQVSKQDSAISLKSGMYDAKPIYSNTLEFPESVGQMYQVKPFYEAKEEEESVNEPGWLNLRPIPTIRLGWHQ
ncbi:hypothetical protein BC830DRAFT_1081053 [Chytriomyces sp. MP71]|nr:hypothetical protein BC830DRAFT_1081053 [Chytriomyces sp. MP71]